MHTETCTKCGKEFQTKVAIPEKLKADSFCSDECYFLDATVQTSCPDWKEG